MNTKIIKKIAKSMPVPYTHNMFMIQGNNGIVLSLDAGYCFDRPDFITEDGIYKAEYLADNIAVKVDRPLDDYPEFDADQLTTDIKIRVTNKTDQRTTQICVKRHRPSTAHRRNPVHS